MQGTPGVANGQIMVLTLANEVAYPNGLSCTFTAANAAFAAIVSSLYVTTTTSTVTLNLNGFALTSGQTFKGSYHVGGY